MTVKLTAIFQIPLPDLGINVLLDHESGIFNVKHGEYEIEMHVHQTPSAAAGTAESVEVLVSKIEDVENHDEISPRYISEITQSYADSASQVIKNAIIFLKYELNQPRLFCVDLNHPSFLNPKWVDADGNEYRAPKRFVEREWKQWLLAEGPYGFEYLKLENGEEFQDALSNPREPSLAEKLLHDANDASSHGDSRQCVVEMAIACEVAINEAYAKSFGRPLKRKGTDRNEYQTLLRGASEVFDNRFRRELIENLKQNIKFLFKCRNKVVHEGKLYYNDDCGKPCYPNMDDWWKSVKTLLEWIRSLD